jgi:hypothetical protein
MARQSSYRECVPSYLVETYLSRDQAGAGLDPARVVEAIPSAGEVAERQRDRYRQSIPSDSSANVASATGHP